jgi:hypothetical protein
MKKNKKGLHELSINNIYISKEEIFLEIILLDILVKIIIIRESEKLFI